MAISRVLGASLVSDLDRQGVDLQFTTLGNSLVYMDFANFRLGVNTASPEYELDVVGTTKLSNILVTNNLISSNTGVIDFGSNANITISGGTLNSVLTTDGSGNLYWADSLANVVFTGNSSFSIIEANLIYEDSYRVLTSNSNIQINGDVVGSGTYSNVFVELVDTGVIAGVYGSADDEYTDYVPKITVDSKGRITNIANVTLTQVGNVSFIDTTISTASNLTLAPASGVIYANASVIKDLSDPVDSQDAVTLGFLITSLTSSAVAITQDDSSVFVVDDGVNPGVISSTVDGGVVSNVSLLYTEFYNTVNIGNLSIADRTITSNGNIILDALGTGVVQFAGTDAVGLPSGADTDRPVNPEIGYIRFNTDRGAIEYWDGANWEVPGQASIISEVIYPNGTSNVYTLGSNASNEGTLVSINGTLQQPGFSYNVVGDQITFSEVPLDTDLIEVRHISVSAVTISRLAFGNTTVDLTSGNIVLNSNLLPVTDSVYDIGSNDLRWRDIYLSGNTIVLGNVILKEEAGSLAVYGSDGVTPATLIANDPVTSSDVVTLGYLQTQLSSIDSTVIQQDDTKIQIVDDGIDAGNIVIAVDGSNVVRVGGNQVTIDVPVTITGNVNATYINADGAGLTGQLGGTLAVERLTGTMAVNQGGTGATTSADALNNLLPSGEQSGYVLKTSGPGTYYWASESGGGGATVGQQLTTLRQSNVATAGQSVFNLIGINYTPGAGQLRVYINGVRQHPDAYTETSANSYTLSQGLSAGTVVFAEIDAFSSFNNYANLTYASNIGNIQAAGLTVQSAIDDLETSKAPLASPVFTGDVTTNSKYYGDGSQLTGTYDNNSLATSLAGGGTYANTSNWTTSTIWQGSTLTLYPDMSVDMNLITILNQVAPGTRITVVDAVEGTFTTTLTAKPTNPGSEWVIPGLESAPTDRTNITSISFSSYSGNIATSGLVTLTKTTEVLDTKSSVTGTVVHNFSTSAIWYYSSISGNVTANITNVPTTDNRVTSVSIVVNQGATGYLVNGIQIDGSAQTIKWQGNTVPTASTNKVDVFTFSLIRAASAWTVLGAATSHG